MLLKRERGIVVLDHMFIKTLNRHTEKVALVYKDVRMSYRELYRNVLKLSEGLSSLGVRQASRVVLVLPNCPEFVLTYYAAAKLQAIFVPLSPLLKEDELTYYINDSGPCVVITDVKRAARCWDVISELGNDSALIVIDGSHPQSIPFNLLLNEQNDNDDVVTLEDDFIQYGGDMVYHYLLGTTGRPKRVGRTQENLFYDAKNMSDLLAVTEADTILCTVPLFHSYGQLLFVLMPICTGATLVILEQMVQDGNTVDAPFVLLAPRVLELIERYSVTLFPAVPYVFGSLVEIPREVKPDLTSLRACFSAGSFLPRETFNTFLERFDIPIRQTYGTTEGGLIAANVVADEEVIYDSVGISPANVEVKILDDDLGELPAGTIGEVVIKSPTLTTGYANMPALNREAFRTGYYFTGDLGKKDEKGHLYLTGRKKLLIDTGGYKVDPLEVEDVLIAHPKVVEAAVVGIAGAGDHILTAFVIVREACTPDELIEYCKERLANFKVPRGVTFCNDFPRSSLGKILREELQRSQEHSEYAEQKAAQDTSVYATLLAASPQERRLLLEAYMCKLLARFLNVAEIEIDDHQHLTKFGFDSLMAIELKHRLETDLGMSISLVKLLQGLTLAEITAALLDQVTSEGPSRLIL